MGKNSGLSPLIGIMLAGLTVSGTVIDFGMVKAGFGWMPIIGCAGLAAMIAIGIHWMIGVKLNSGFQAIASKLSGLVAAAGCIPVGMALFPSQPIVGASLLTILILIIGWLLRKKYKSALPPITFLVLGAFVLITGWGLTQKGITRLLTTVHSASAEARINPDLNIPVVKLNPLKDALGHLKARQYSIIVPALDKLERSSNWASIQEASNEIFVAGPLLNPDLEDIRKGYKPIWVEYAIPYKYSIERSPRITLYPISTPPPPPNPGIGSWLIALGIQTALMLLLTFTIPTGKHLFLLPISRMAGSLLAPLLVVLAVDGFKHILTFEQIPFSIQDWMTSTDTAAIRGAMGLYWVIATIGFVLWAFRENKKRRVAQSSSQPVN